MNPVSNHCPRMQHASRLPSFEPPDRRHCARVHRSHRLRVPIPKDGWLIGCRFPLFDCPQHLKTGLPDKKGSSAKRKRAIGILLISESQVPLGALSDMLSPQRETGRCIRSTRNSCHDTLHVVKKRQMFRSWRPPSVRISADLQCTVGTGLAKSDSAALCAESAKSRNFERPGPHKKTRMFHCARLSHSSERLAGIRH